MSYAELIAEQKEETREIIAALLEDGSEPEALYTIEHHFSADTFEELELDPEDGGGKVVCFDAVMESALNAELIDEQAEKLIILADKHSIDYDGWGTYFESDEDDDEEESEDEE